MLDVEPVQGAWTVVKDGMGLRVGDVLRACSTLELRYDSARREVRRSGGFRGKGRGSGRGSGREDRGRPAKAADSEFSLMRELTAPSRWLREFVADADAELGGFLS